MSVIIVIACVSERQKKSDSDRSYFCDAEGWVGNGDLREADQIGHIQKVSSGGVRVRFRVRFQAVKVQFPVHSQLRTQLERQLPQSSSKGNFFVRVQLTRLSEYSSVAYSVERPTWETRTQQYSDIVLVSTLK